eukprot:2276044-Rhodomonas_salina.1
MSTATRDTSVGCTCSIAAWSAWRRKSDGAGAACSAGQLVRQRGAMLQASRLLTLSPSAVAFRGCGSRDYMKQGTLDGRLQGRQNRSSTESTWVQWTKSTRTTETREAQETWAERPVTRAFSYVGGHTHMAWCKVDLCDGNPRFHVTPVLPVSRPSRQDAAGSGTDKEQRQNKIYE